MTTETPTAPSPSHDLRKEAIAYVLLVILLSIIPNYFMISAGTMRAGGGLWVVAVMWCPGLAAIFLQLFYRRTLKGLGWGIGNWRLLGWSYILPVLYAAPVYLLVWLFKLGGFPNPLAHEAMQRMFGIGHDLPLGVAVRFAAVALPGVALGLLTATGEEIGWRGYLVPRLSALVGPTKATFLTGTIWALWHFPAIFFVDYNGGTPGWFSAAMFFLMVIAGSFAFTWVRLASGSLWSAALLHATHNAFVQAFFDAVTVDTGITRWFTGEFGVGLALTCAITAWIIWKKKFPALSSSESPASA